MVPTRRAERGYWAWQAWSFVASVPAAATHALTFAALLSAVLACPAAAVA